MHYLILIIGGLIGFAIHYIHRRKTTKECPHCGERIKKKAILCRFCNQSLVTPLESFKQDMQGFSQNLIKDSLKEVTTIALLSATKSFFGPSFFVIQGIKFLTQNKNKK